MTRHVSEENLILHYYGEEAETGIDDHLALCHECRGQYQRLQHVLNVVDIPVPERDSSYEERVWNRLAPRIGVRRRWSWLSSTWLKPRKWAPALALSAVIVAAFLAGRYSPEIDGTKAPVATQQPVRERVLVVAVGDHLERSQMVLIELKNSADQKDTDITNEQELAMDLLSANRLYRQTANAAGQREIVLLLEDLERVLADVVHRPSTINASQLADIRERIEGQGLLFKMRVMGSNLNDRVTQSAPSEESEQL